MTLSFRSKLLASHVALVLVAGSIALFTLDRALAADLVRQLDQRLEDQGKGAIEWAEGGKRHPDRITTRIANIVEAEVTLFEKDGTVLGASSPEARTDIGPELAAAQAGSVGRATRRRDGRDFHYVAVPGSEGTVLRLAQPLSEVNETVAAMRRRLLFASTLAVLVAIVLGILASRVASRPLSEMTTTATRLARGDFDAPIPEGDRDEFGVLWRALKSLASQLKARIGELVEEGDRLQRLMTVRRDFVANVSHELRTPVTSIQGYAETLLRKDTPPETRHQFLEVIHRQAQRIGALVEQLLALSELEARGRDDLARESVSVLSVARHVAETVAGHAEDRSVTVDVEGVDGSALVFADPEGVERALLNLVDNAVTYGKAGGNVTVTAVTTTERGREGVAIIVADDGEGIEPQHLPRIFERFYRVDSGRSRQHGGAGLGLAIVKHLIESMDGSIEVESEVGKGTRFRVTLPAPRPSMRRI
ncbi:MAG: HAMP domain-containing protein [Labilithrix sp.]|nr:HAMP domain-containing protein [Labilithrix sp.]MBX3225248.1 HAMP domain-containing protein [Labilithrix sp.]